MAGIGDLVPVAPSEVVDTPPVAPSPYASYSDEYLRILSPFDSAARQELYSREVARNTQKRAPQENVIPPKISVDNAAPPMDNPPVAPVLNRDFRGVGPGEVQRPSPRNAQVGSAPGGPPSPGLENLMPAPTDVSPLITMLREQMGRAAPSPKGFLPERPQTPSFTDTMTDKDNMVPLLLALAQGLAQPNTPFVTGLANAGANVVKTAEGIRGQKAKEISDLRKEQLEEFQQAVNAARLESENNSNKTRIAGTIVETALAGDKANLDRFKTRLDVQKNQTDESYKNAMVDHYKRSDANDAARTSAIVNLHNKQAEAVGIDIKDPVWRQAQDYAKNVVKPLEEALKGGASSITPDDAAKAYNKAMSDYLRMRGRTEEADYFTKLGGATKANDPLGIR